NAREPRGPRWTQSKAWDELQEHHERRQEFDQTVGAKGQKHGAPRAPCRKESQGALHHHPDQRDHLQPHNLARYFAGSSCASRGVGQCPAPYFFFQAHSAYITALGRSCLGMAPVTCRRYIRCKPPHTATEANPSSQFADLTLSRPALQAAGPRRRTTSPQTA